MLTHKNLTGWSLYSFLSCSRAFNSSLHGWHHVAPNEMSTTCPRIFAISYVLPSAPLKLNPSGSSGRFAVVESCACVLVPKPASSNTHRSVSKPVLTLLRFSMYHSPFSLVHIGNRSAALRANDAVTYFDYALTRPFQEWTRKDAHQKH